MYDSEVMSHRWIFWVEKRCMSNPSDKFRVIVMSRKSQRFIDHMPFIIYILSTVQFPYVTTLFWHPKNVTLYERDKLYYHTIHP